LGGSNAAMRCANGFVQRSGTGTLDVLSMTGSLRLMCIRRIPSVGITGARILLGLRMILIWVRSRREKLLGVASRPQGKGVSRTNYGIWVFGWAQFV
jgi:hypothetical protein